MSQQPAQVGVPTPSAPHPGAGRPQQVLNVQTEMFIPQPSLPSAGRKMAASPKIQTLKSLPSQSSAGKRFVHKELLPAKDHSQVQSSDSVRYKFRETLAAAFSTGHQFGQQQSAGDVSESPLGSAAGNTLADTTASFQVSGNKDGDENVTEVVARRSEHCDMLPNNLRQTEHVHSGNKVVSGNCSAALEDILQDSTLCWDPDAVAVGPSESMSQGSPKRARMSDVHAGVKPVSQIGPDSRRAITADQTTEEKKARMHKSQILAFQIEEELFKLFGLVNKKYKEKGRSLLFNLKDKNNPALMERVLSGDITPRCLCAMTTQELASKELSEWRMAKAEELANMVVLPDMEVDVRCLVRKTHKGESQVEVEETDVVEVGLGGGSLSCAKAQAVDKTSVHKEVKESDNSVEDGVAETCSSDRSSNLEYPANEKSDLMQKPMTGDVEVTEDLPEIMTLDEFMQVLHSEPYSEDHSAGAMQDDPSIDKADKALKAESFPIIKDKAAALKFQFESDLPCPQGNFESKLESPMKKLVSVMDPVLEPKGDVMVKFPPKKVDTEKPDTVNGLTPESIMQCKITPDAALTHDKIWQGTIQLSLTSLTSIVAIFKSGEKTSTIDWRRFLEIKGRVRLRVFKEFLEQLPKSRSRAIMVTELCLKEGSLESGRHHLLQTIDSYIADGRVGLVNPAEGVEIYLCPQGEAVKILADHLPKQHSSSLIVTETSIIGLVVWRRPHVSPKVLPNGQDVPKSRAMIPSSIVPRISQPPSRSSNACRSAHGLPGSGPGVVKDDDDDLPEHNLVSISNSALNATTSQTDRSHRHASLSEYRAREMIRKYGTEPVAAQPWNGDGDEFASMRATVPVQRPLTYGHLMRPAQQSCYGVPDDIGYCSGSWNQGLMAWNPW